MNKPEVGQEVFVVTRGNYARSRVKTYTGEITKVGRKYFEIDFSKYHRSVSFHLDTWIHNNGNYIASYQAYESEVDYSIEISRQKLHRSLCEASFFSPSRPVLSFEQLEAIAKITGLHTSAGDQDE